MKDVSRHLHKKDTGKVLNLRLTDKTLISESGTLSKLRTTKKCFPSSEDAYKALLKKEWNALKKGFNLHSETTKKGQAILHTFIGGSYTGCLSFAETSNGIFVYKNTEATDYLILIDKRGNLLKEIILPEQLAWTIEFNVKNRSLLLDIDHSIYEYNIENNSFMRLIDREENFESFLTLANEKTAFASGGKFYICKDQGNIIHKQNHSTELVNGNIPFCGKLSSDGTLLAFHNKVGEIQIIDTATGEVLNIIVADFHILKQLEFTNNNNLLVTRELHDTCGIRYFDLLSNKEIQIVSLEIPEYSKSVDAFCFDDTQSKLVLIQRTNAHVFDFKKRKLLHSFKIEHTVKNCSIRFVSSFLGVRSDYGCFSLYRI